MNHLENNLEELAKKYFDAFHAGRLDEVFSYFADEGVVKYGTEPDKLAKDFFPETKDMISQIQFETHGIYASRNTNNVIIHFSFTMPSSESNPRAVEAIDIIEFDDNKKIKRVKVIPNG